MQCPKCKTEMIDEIRHSVILSSCDVCKGSFLTRETFLTAASDERHAEVLAQALSEVKATRPSDFECPTGDGAQLEALDIQAIEIDRCPTCFGLYFDRGELQALVQRRPELPKVEWRESPRLTAKGVVTITLLPDFILGGIFKLLP